MLTKYDYDTMLTNSRNFIDLFKIFDNDLYGSNSMKAYASSTAYRVNTTENELDLSIDVPGLKAKDLSVQTFGRDIKISGKIRGENFKYSYQLSKDFDPDTVDASLEDGVLTLKFHKLKQPPSKVVEVKIK